jgi:hypothetical protein
VCAAISAFYSFRYISPGGEEQAVFRNGTVITLFRDGRKETEFSNGQKETLCVASMTNHFTLKPSPSMTMSHVVADRVPPEGTPMVQRSALIPTVLSAFCAWMEALALLIQMAHTESKVHVACSPASKTLTRDADGSGRIIEQSGDPSDGGQLLQP